MSVMVVIFFVVSLVASILGSICGIGGGVVIKPVLDATGVATVSSISFLSGCTVLAMSVISVYKNKKNKNQEIKINQKIGTPFAIGAAIGGIVGKEMFHHAYVLFEDNKVGAIQSLVLLVITIGTLVYTWKKSKIKTMQINNFFVILCFGVILGILSSFLGIGGGPINVVVLGYFFSMEIKQAAANSLYIIMISQGASLLNTIVKGKIPEFEWKYLIVMVLGGIIGGSLGSKINKKLQGDLVDKLFVMIMIVIIGINIFNAYQFII